MTQSVRILLVDDDETISHVLLEALRIHGYEDVTWVPDGRQAVEAYRTLLPDLVLMDITMPVMDGYEASCRIKAFDPSARIVVLTGNSKDPRAFRILKEKIAECVLQKPIRLIDLRDVIERPLDSAAPDGSCALSPRTTTRRSAVSGSVI